MKKLYATLATIGCGVASAFAEGSAILDTSDAVSTLTQLKTDLSGFVTSALPILAGVAGAFLAFWLIKLGIRMIKSFVGSGK